MQVSLGKMCIIISPVFLSPALSVLELFKRQQLIKNTVRCYFGRKLPAVLPQLQDKSNDRKKKLSKIKSEATPKSSQVVPLKL